MPVMHIFIDFLICLCYNNSKYEQGDHINEKIFITFVVGNAVAGCRL